MTVTSYPVFYGFVEGWPVSFNETDTTVSVNLVDGFKVLSLALVSGDFPQQSSDARITAILAAAAWPATEVDIAAGSVTVPAITLDKVSALEHIQQIAHAEGGRFFMSRAGKATFRARSPEVNPDLSKRIWADDGTGMTYRDVNIVCDDELVMNDIHLTRVGGVEQIVSDLISQADFGIRSVSETDIQLSSDPQVLDLANVMLTRYTRPVQRIQGLVDNAMKHGLWDRVLGRELADAVQVVETQTATSQVSSIEGIQHTLEGGTWTVTLSVAPAPIVKAGILDDATYGLLDSTAILA